MQLRNLWSVENDRLVNIQTVGGKILNVAEYDSTMSIEGNGVILDFENAIVFPGLINSHDHLDFNSFPQLGNKKYANYVDWGNDIHDKNKDVINKVLKIPKELRVQLGIYKNLLNGITTVVNHGPKLQVENSAISIFQQCDILHSVQLERNWILKLNKLFRKKLPIAVHVGEGTDVAANQEIDKLINWNILGRNLIGIHGIAMNEKQARKFKALVWCPASNEFLIGKTADISALKKQTTLLFGTDSNVSASWNIWDHLRLARQFKMASEEELLNSITKNAAQIWKLENHGELKNNFAADITIARKSNQKNLMDAFFEVQPKDILCVLHKGEIKLFDAELYDILAAQNMDMRNFYSINVQDSEKYIWGNLPALISKIKEYYPEAVFPVN